MCKLILVYHARNIAVNPRHFDFPSFQVSLVCMRACTHVHLFVCFPVLRVCMLPKGKQAVWGVICFYRGWQLITNPDKHWGRGEGRERERWQTSGERKKGEIAQGRGIDIWIPQSNRRALWILSSPPPHGFGLELDHCAAAHLALWQLIDPHQYRYTQRWRAAEKTRDDFWWVA